jgi:CubicO group peptidase (beta-lactamase class C family)
VGSLVGIERWPVTAAAVVVVGPEGVLDRYGPTDSVVGIASVTKLLVAVGALVALEEGSLLLDDAAGPPGSTVRHLLAHASGLPFDGGPPIAPPGTRRIYSNAGFDELGTCLAAGTGMPTASYLREAVLEPLGMTMSELRGSPAKDGWSSVDDLATFAVELLQPRLVTPETLRVATTTAFPGLAGVLPGIGRMTPNDWGLGFELRDNKAPHWTGTSCSSRTFGHFGRSGGFLWVDPDVRLGVACLTDREFGAWSLSAWPELSDAVIAQWADRPLG